MGERPISDTRARDAHDTLGMLLPLTYGWWVFAAFALLAGNWFGHFFHGYSDLSSDYAPQPLVVALLLIGVVGFAWGCARTRRPLSPAIVVVAAASFAPFFMIDALDTVMAPVRFRSLSHFDTRAQEAYPRPSMFALQLFCWFGAYVGMRLWLGHAARRPFLPSATLAWHRAAHIFFIAGLCLLAWSVALGARRPPSEEALRVVAELRPVLSLRSSSDIRRFGSEFGASQRLSGGGNLMAEGEGVRLATDCQGWCFALSRAGQSTYRSVSQIEELGEQARRHGVLDLRRTPGGDIWLLTERDDDRMVIAAAWEADDLSPMTVRLHHLTSVIAPSRFATLALTLGLVLAATALALRRRAKRRLTRIEGGIPGHLSPNGWIVLDGGQMLKHDSTGVDASIVVLAYSSVSTPFRDHGTVASRDVLLGHPAALAGEARLRITLCDAIAVAVMLLPLASVGMMSIAWIL